MSEAEAAAPSSEEEEDGNSERQSRKRSSFPVVGIGASAGGLEACQILLKALPANLGMAFVIVPHLDPSRESAFRDILARSTTMTVSEVEDGMTAAPDHVYVIPRNCELTIAKGVLHIAQREQPRPVNTTIDIFLRSLAADQAGNAIGVILSGTASDGTIGLAAIKGEGGITFAQDSSAKYDGMPASAIAAGCVDRVLPPEGIAKELTRMSRHPYVRGAGLKLEAIGSTVEVQMSQLFGMLRRVTGVDFSEYKLPTIGRRVARRMALHKIEKLPDYVALLQHDREEILALYQDLLINVTSFFRDPNAFEALKSVVYTDLLKHRPSNTPPIRIWVPGCSTGEETYSHAIALVEFLGEERSDVSIQIFGTDLSENAIQRARAGLYKETIEADVSPVRLRRFFQRVDSGYQISKSIRDLCIFSTQNVFNDPPFSRIDLVSCRNVMIYLSQSLQRRIIPVFHYALNVNGFLMIGNTEGLLGSGPELFEMADKKQKIYRKKSVPTPLPFGFAVQVPEYHPGNNAGEIAAKSASVEPTPIPVDLQREADRLLLARYAPPSVVVNDQLEIVQTKGHTGLFLELPTGKVSLNLLKMARPGLLFDLQSAIDEARKSGVDAIRPNVPMEGNGGNRTISLRVTPFRTPIRDKSSFLVTFEAANGTPATSPETSLSSLSDDERTMKDNQIAQIRQELASTREYLQSIIEALESTNEELQSANEEIQSGNEELQSTNEELQTSKEELESANEELQTVNEEMQHRNELLTQLNNDLTNLLNSVNLPVVMLGPDLGVRRFTPQAAKVLGLTATDVGRPITRLRLKIDVGSLEQMMLDVISEVRPSQYRIKDSVGRWCDLRLTPYRTADNRIDGLVLNILGLDELDSSDRQSKEAEPASRAAESAAKPKKTVSKKKAAKNGSRRR
ncbi:MAG TPA: chemotaxis protein CheB [Terriglobales bacterium]|jgi:two-component system CheB/CheR fusion protein